MSANSSSFELEIVDGPEPVSPLWQRALVWAGLALLLSAIAAAAAYVYVATTPSGQIQWRLLTAETPYDYAEIDPRFLATDPAHLIDLDDADWAVAKRRRTTRILLGTNRVAPSLVPDRTQILRQAPLAPYASTVERLDLRIDQGFTAALDLYHPKEPSDRLVIYHHGGTGPYEQSAEILREFLARGVGVLAVNMPGFGDSALNSYDHPRYGRYRQDPGAFLTVAQDPMGHFFRPLGAAVNFAVTERGYARLDMVGFSRGAWVATVYAVLDPRIEKTVTIAGIYPLYLTWGVGYERPREQLYRPLLRSTNYLELFALAALGPGREVVQIFNRYDPCCFRNTKGTLYADAVDATVRRLGGAGGGRFRVLIDESHADHAVSAWAKRHLIETLFPVENEGK